MSNIDYEAEVKKVYPDAVLNGDVDVIDNTLLWWIEDGNENRISDIHDEFQVNAWRTAYEYLKQQGKI